MDASAIAQTALQPAVPKIPHVDPGKKGFEAEARKQAEDFEAVFLTTMLGEMFSGIKTDPPFGGGPSEQTFRGLLIGEYAKELSHSGGIGIAEQVYREILATQEGVNQ